MNRRNLLSFGPLALVASALGIKSTEAKGVDKYIPVLYTDPDAKRFTGPDGTFFMMEPLARTRDSLDYFMKAYTPDRKYFYRRIELNCMFVEAMERGNAHGVSRKLHEYLQEEFETFIREFYDGRFQEAVPSKLSMELKSWDV